MPSATPERDNQQLNQEPNRSPSASRSHSPPRRSISPRTASVSRTPDRAFSDHGPHTDARNGIKDTHRSRSPTRSESPSGARRRERERSYTRSRSRGSHGPKSSKIVVEKLTKNVNENHLKEIFGVYGTIREVDLPINKQFMTNRGTAYILYNDTAHAEAAIAHMHEAQVDGAVINVSIVLPRRKLSRSPPPTRRGRPPFDRFDSRGPPGGYRNGPPPPDYGAPPPNGRYRSPQPQRRASPPRRYPGRGGPRERDLDTYRPRSYSRSRSPATRSRSVSSRSRSRSPVRRSRGGFARRESRPPVRGRRRRSPSYSSYSSYSDRSRSRSRGRYGRGRN